MGTRSARGVAALTLGCVAFGAASASGFFGGPDPTFGGDGIVKTNGPGGGPDDINDVVALPSGELLAAGNVATASGGQDLAVFKYEEDGSLDTTFGGGDGIATADIDGAASSDRGYAIEVQGDGKIVVAGQTRANSPGADEDVAVVRFESDGTLDDDGDDTGFSGDGIATPAISSSEPDRANDLAIDASGRIVVAGYFEEGEVLEDYEGDFLAVRLTSAGVLDADFDGDGGAGNGVVRVSFGSGDFHFEEAYGVDLADDGDVILGGEVYTGDTTSETVIGLARLDAADGGLDTAFDEDGLVTTDLGTDGIALGLVTSDGTVAVAGASGSSLVAARYEQADGDLDPTFGNGGILTIPGSEIGVNQISGNDIAIDDARYLLSAQISDSEDGEDVGAVALTGSGQLDTEFSEDGVAQVSTAPPDGLDRTAAVTAVNDGNALSRNKVLIAGQSSPDEPETTDALVIRLGPDITPPSTTITKPKAGKTKDRTPKLRFTVDEDATSRCRIDSEPWIEDCASGQTFPRQARGRHVLRVQSTDLDGNVEQPPAKRAFKIVR